MRRCLSLILLGTLLIIVEGHCTERRKTSAYGVSCHDLQEQKSVLKRKVNYIFLNVKKASFNGRNCNCDNTVNKKPTEDNFQK